VEGTESEEDLAGRAEDAESVVMRSQLCTEGSAAMGKDLDSWDVRGGATTM